MFPRICLEVPLLATSPSISPFLSLIHKQNPALRGHKQTAPVPKSSSLCISQIVNCALVCFRSFRLLRGCAWMRSARPVTQLSPNRDGLFPSPFRTSARSTVIAESFPLTCQPTTVVSLIRVLSPPLLARDRSQESQTPNLTLTLTRNITPSRVRSKSLFVGSVWIDDLMFEPANPSRRTLDEVILVFLCEALHSFCRLLHPLHRL